MQRFQAGGTVREGSTYIERKADGEIARALFEGEFCYVLAPRQIGKSSLRIRAQRKLREEGVRCASVDLTSIGTTGISDEEWYFGLIEEIAGQLEIGRDPAEFWEKRRSLSPVHRFSHFLADEILAHIPDKIVISIDEIDAVLALPFASDDFFAAIRAIYNKRAEDPSFARLTFCIYGVATPAELIKDPTRTPFNIGRGIRLLDFTRAEAEALLPGLAAVSTDAPRLLDAVLGWTSGHPYMTQRVCMALTKEPPPEGVEIDAHVDALIDRLFLQRGRTEEPNLAYAEKRIQKAEPALRTRMLRVYRRLLHGETISAKGDDPAEIELRLAGLAADHGDEEGEPRLLIRNRVVARVFDLRWVDENDSSNPLAEPVAMWLQWKRGDDFLLRGAALEVALAWAKGRDDLSPEEHEFLRASVLRVEQQSSASQRRRLAVIMSVLLLLLGFLGMAYVLKENELKAEQRATEQAESARKDAEGRLDAARADLDTRAKQAESAQKDAENKAQAALDEAAKLQAKVDELELAAQAAAAQGKTEAEQVRKQVDDAKSELQSALQRAYQEREVAVVAKDVAAKAVSAASRSQGPASAVEKTPEAERAARDLADQQLKFERASRERVEKELAKRTADLTVCQKDRDRNIGKDAPKGSLPNAPIPLRR